MGKKSFEKSIIDIAIRAINGVTNPGIKRLSQEAAKKFGVNGLSSRDQIALDRAKMQLEKQQMENRMYRYKLEEKELAIEDKRRVLEEAKAEKAELAIPQVEVVIDGALTIPQDRGGIIFPDEPEGYAEWLDSLAYGKVILILGRRGSGKTALAARIAEYISATFGLSIYWVGLPEEARDHLPRWIKLVNSPEQCPPGSVILADEAGLRYASLAFNIRENQLLRKLLMIARHRNSSLIFSVQSSRDLEASAERQADTVIFKQPGLNQPETERLDIRPRARRAAEVFRQIPAEKRPASAFVFDDLFSGIITTTLPSFWSDELSHIYRHVDLSQLEARGRRAVELDQVVREEMKLLEADSLDSQILKLRSEGYGVEKIAKILGISVYRVRKCLGI
ncbi:ATP-binding protein [Chloroflexota bacterium]